MFGRGVAYDVGTRVVSLLTSERLEMRSHRGDHATGLHRVLPDHVQAAQQQRFLRHRSVRDLRRGPGEQCDERTAQRAARDIDRAPLGFIEQDGALQRREDGLQTSLQ
jgi:hypothetical protein